MARAKGDEYIYDAFVSYSHAHDRDVADELQRQLQTFGRPFYRPRSMRIFRDVTNLAASPGLPNDIERALAQSRWLIVMASPVAAESKWVRQELAWWVDHRGGESMLIAWTDGELVWDDDAGAFDWGATTALPAGELAEAFHSQPRWVDLRWMRDASAIVRQDPRLLEAAADFVAKLRGRPKDEVIGDHLRQQRRIRRWIVGVGTILILLTMAAGSAAAVANQQRNRAQEQRYAALARQLVAQATVIQDSSPDLARQLLVESYRLQPDGPAAGAVLGSAVIPRVMPVTGYARDVTYSPSGDILAVSSAAGVTLVDPKTLKARGPALGTPGYAGRSVFSPDGRLLVTSDGQGYIQTFDVAERSRPVRLGSARVLEAIDDLAFSADPPTVAAIGGGAETVLVNIGDPKQPREIARLERFDVVPLNKAVALAPNGQLLAATGGNSTVRLWSLHDPAHPQPLPSLAVTASAMSFSFDGNLLAIGGEDDTTRVWDVSVPTHLAQRANFNGQSFGIDSLTFSHDSATLAIGGGDGTIDMWSFADPLKTTLGGRLTGHSAGIADLSFSGDDTVLASASADGPLTAANGTAEDNGSVRLWRVNGSIRSSAAGRIPEAGGGIPAFTADGRSVAVGTPPAFWDLTQPTTPRRLRDAPYSALRGVQQVDGLPEELMVPSAETPQPLGVSPDHSELALVDKDGAAQLWDLSTPAPQRLAIVSSDAKFQSVALGPDRILLTGDKLGGVMLWDLRDTRHVRLLGSASRHAGAVKGLAINPSGTFAASGSTDGTVRLWQVSRQSRLTEAAVMTAGTLRGAATLAFSPNGKLLAGVNGDGMQLWDMDLAGALQRLCAESTRITQQQWNQYLADQPYDPPCR